MLRTAAIPIDLIDAVTNYVGRAPQVRNFDIVDDAAWALLPESKEEWLYGGIAAIFTPAGNIVVRQGYEDAAIHELLHAAGFMPWGVGDFINEGITQTVAEEICGILELPVRRSYGPETSFVRQYLLRLLARWY